MPLLQGSFSTRRPVTPRIGRGKEKECKNIQKLDGYQVNV